MSGDEELVKLIWQVISASLNGNYSYRKSIWFVGEGNDGKGTVQQLITNVVGMKNVASLKINQFAERFSLSMIEGKTVVIGDDVQAGIYVDESSNFNSVVTGEPVLVEEKINSLTQQCLRKLLSSQPTNSHGLKIKPTVHIDGLRLSHLKNHFLVKMITGQSKTIISIVRKCWNTC